MEFLLQFDLQAGMSFERMKLRREMKWKFHNYGKKLLYFNIAKAFNIINELKIVSHDENLKSKKKIDPRLILTLNLFPT